jgi:hypothetical protein
LLRPAGSPGALLVCLHLVSNNSTIVRSNAMARPDCS